MHIHLHEYINSMGWAMGSNPELWESAKHRIGNDVTANFFEVIVQETIGRDDIRLKHIVIGIDAMTLYDYRKFGFIQQ